jgi:hypothetical protein
MMSLDIPPKTWKPSSKSVGAFLWKGRRYINCSQCLVAWDKVASPKDFVGLGIPSLCLLNLALRCRWAWLKKVDPDKAWAEFNIQLPHLSLALFNSATCYMLGNGEIARFWTYRWLNGLRVVDVAPHVVASGSGIVDHTWKRWPLRSSSTFGTCLPTSSSFRRATTPWSVNLMLVA